MREGEVCVDLTGYFLFLFTLLYFLDLDNHSGNQRSA